MRYTYSNKYSLLAEETMLQRREPHTYPPILKRVPVVANMHTKVWWDECNPKFLKLFKREYTLRWKTIHPLHITHSFIKLFAVKCPDIAHPDTHQQGAVVGRGGQRSTQTRGWGENRQARGEDPQCTHV